MIEQLISENLPDAVVNVSSPDNVHYEALVISPAFEGKAMLQRHRMVYATLGTKMGHEIHALGLTTLTPGENS